VNRRNIFRWLIALVVVAIIILAAFYFDEPVRQFIAQHQSQALRNFMRNVSRFGDWPEHFLFGLLLAALAWWRGKKNWTRILLCMLLALSIAGLAGRIIKISTGRARPSVKTEQVWNGLRFGSKYHAFPSGHVGASTAFFGVLLFTKRRIGLPCMAIPIVIGFARVYLAAHYLSDAVCAAVLGLFSAWIVSRIFLRESLSADHQSLVTSHNRRDIGLKLGEQEQDQEQEHEQERGGFWGN
jgi:membrane-associated phospholipid phosphatase